MEEKSIFPSIKRGRGKKKKKKENIIIGQLLANFVLFDFSARMLMPRDMITFYGRIDFLPSSV